ncbi:MAG: Wzz/FepE/Etk N-terminal domain-containing protein [Ruminococcus sp.]|nr:Wzz/FepE/Etk N-terminal domain-containing protein [Ruminococcus sp.]
MRKAEGSQEKYESLKSERIWNKDMPSLIKKTGKANQGRDEIQIDLVQLLKAVWRKIWLVIILAIVGALLTFLYANFLVTP